MDTPLLQHAKVFPSRSLAHNSLLFVLFLVSDDRLAFAKDCADMREAQTNEDKKKIFTTVSFVPKACTLFFRLACVLLVCLMVRCVESILFSPI